MILEGVGTIINDDTATIFIDDVTQTEGDFGNSTFTFSVTLDREVDIPVTLNYSTVADSATATDRDYTEASGRLINFAANNGPGPQTQAVPISVIGDAKLEIDEQFFVDLFSLRNSGRAVTVSDPQGVGTILDDDAATIVIDDPSILEGNVGNRNLVFTVTLNAAVAGDVSLAYSVSSDTAVAGVDYSPVADGTLTFGPTAGSQTRTIAVPIIGDRTVELDETLFVTLSGLTDSGEGVTIADGVGVGTISNDDVASISINSLSRNEGNASGGVYSFNVTLNNAVDTGLTVGYAVVDGTAALADSDYFADPGSTLSFTGNAGESSHDHCAGDPGQQGRTDRKLPCEPVERGCCRAKRGSGCQSGNGHHRQRRHRFDQHRRCVAYRREFRSCAGGLHRYAQRRGRYGNKPPVRNRRRHGHQQFERLHRWFRKSQSFRNPEQFRHNQRACDGRYQRGKTMKRSFVDLSALAASGRAVTIAGGRGQGTIVNNDFVNVSLFAGQVFEGYTATGTSLPFTVTRDNNTVPVTISFSTLDGTATVADGDYVARTGSVTLPEGGALTQQILVDVIGDHVNEPNETVTLSVSTTTPGLVTIANPLATGTILNDDGFVSGQKWYDIDNDGVKDANEPGLDGWVIQLLDNVGNVVTSGVTGSVDLNNDGDIDPATERGLYTIPANQGSWNIQEVLRDGWRQTFPDGGNSLAYQLDQAHNLEFTGNLFEDWGGLGEKWLRGNDQWFFITPAGNLFQWDRSPRSNLTGTFLGAVGSRFHASPSLLYDAQPDSVRFVTVTADQTASGIDFGNIPTGRIEGRKWHDVDADNIRDASEPWLNGWTITLRDEGGNVVRTAVTADLDRNGDGQIDPATETGWYRFDNLLPGTFTASEEQRSGWTQSGASGSFASEAYRLDQELNFRQPQNDFRNWGGRNERWVFGNTGWHFITPDGRLYLWNKSPRTALTGQLVATLNPSYWQDLSLIYNAQPPNEFRVQISGQEVSDLNFGNIFGHNGAGSGNVTATVSNGTLTITGDGQANTVVIYVDQSGATLVAGGGGTTVNGLNSAFAAGVSGNTIADLGAGNDQLVVFGTSIPAGTGTGDAIRIETGAGDDRVSISQVNAGRTVTIANSSGSDVRRIQASQLAGLSLTGSGSSAIENSSLNGNLSANSSGAGNTVIVNSNIAGTTNIVGSAVSDAVIAARSIFGGTFTASGGVGNDFIALLNSQFNAPVSIRGDAGNDTFSVRRNNTFGSTAAFSGNAGSDRFSTDGTSTSQTLSSIESTINSDLENLIDLALGNFDDLMLGL